jgi:hypothetical protein
MKPIVEVGTIFVDTFIEEKTTAIAVTETYVTIKFSDGETNTFSRDNVERWIEERLWKIIEQPKRNKWLERYC